MQTPSIAAALLAITVSLSTAAVADEFQDLLASFGNLSTVAGKGDFRGNGFNGWQANMEGTQATTVELSRPHMTMADLDGNLYIADKDAHAIRRVRLDGSLHTIAGTNTAGFNGDGVGTAVQLNQPNGLYTMPDGTTYILDLGNSRIRRLTADGQLTTLLEDTDGIVAGRGLWVSVDESLLFYSSGNRIRKWTPQGGVETVATGFVQLGNLSVNPFNGQLVATDRGGNRVYEIAADGSKQVIAGNGGTSGGVFGGSALGFGLEEVRGVYFETTGGYYLATHDGGQITYVDSQGLIHLVIDGDNDHTHAGDGLPLSSPGRKISEPRAVTLAPNGDLLVTENDFGYVRHAPRLAQLAGDFDRDGAREATDIDLLSAAVRSQTHYQLMNLNAEQGLLVDQEDRRIWVEELVGTEFGDTNLDGTITASVDGAALLTGLGATSPQGWANGDTDGDGIVTASLDGAVLLAGLSGDSRGRTAVPEPGSALLLILAAVSAVLARQRWWGR